MWLSGSCSPTMFISCGPHNLDVVVCKGARDLGHPHQHLGDDAQRGVKSAQLLSHISGRSGVLMAFQAPGAAAI